MGAQEEAAGLLRTLASRESLQTIHPSIGVGVFFERIGVGVGSFILGSTDFYISKKFGRICISSCFFFCDPYALLLEVNGKKDLTGGTEVRKRQWRFGKNCSASE